MSISVLETLRAANRNLRSRLARLQPGSNSFSAIGPQDFLDMREELQRAIECLRQASAPDIEMQKEIAEYRGNLEQLVAALPAIHGWLLAEKARLESKRAHLDATASWLSGTKSTL